LSSSGTSFIQLESVSKIYRGLRRRVRAVEEFSLGIELGEVFGLAGPNGAGKSTLISLILGFLKPTSGTIRIGGRAPREYVERNGMGYLSEMVYVPPRWRLEEALARYAILAGLSSARVPSRIDELIELLGLAEHRGKQIRQLSKGNLQRVGLAQALLYDEQVLVLDEPTHGLDPLWTQRFREIVAKVRRPDRAIFIASHNLDELQRIADRVAIIDHGRLQRVVAMRAADESAAATPYRIVLARGIDVARELFPAARVVAPDELELPPTPLHVLNDGLRMLLERGALLTSMAPVYSSLEQHFRDAVAGADARRPDDGGR